MKKARRSERFRLCVDAFDCTSDPIEWSGVRLFLHDSAGVRIQEITLDVNTVERLGKEGGRFTFGGDPLTVDEGEYGLVIEAQDAASNEIRYPIGAPIGLRVRA